LVQPLAAAVYAAWILDERLTLVQFAGGAIVLTAIVLANRARR
jgi:drug/metabolite transporter (DMT)-like permease